MKKLYYSVLKNSRVSYLINYLFIHFLHIIFHFLTNLILIIFYVHHYHYFMFIIIYS